MDMNGLRNDTCSGEEEFTPYNISQANETETRQLAEVEYIRGTCKYCLTEDEVVNFFVGYL